MVSLQLLSMLNEISGDKLRFFLLLSSKTTFTKHTINLPPDFLSPAPGDSDWLTPSLLMLGDQEKDCFEGYTSPMAHLWPSVLHQPSQLSYLNRRVRVNTLHRDSGQQLQRLVITSVAKIIELGLLLSDRSPICILIYV